MIRKTAAVLLIASLSASLALADDKVQWGSSEKTYRQPAEGIKGYYEPEKIVREEDTVSFKVYRSPDPAVADEVGSYMVNCQTREYVTLVKGRPDVPTKLLAGEALFPMASKFCKWDDKGFFKSLF